jgi:hypothetical protein
LHLGLAGQSLEIWVQNTIGTAQSNRDGSESAPVDLSWILRQEAKWNGAQRFSL